MLVCTQLRDWKWDAERGFHLAETGLQLQAGTSTFPSSPSVCIEKLPLMTYFLVWGCGKQEQISTLHCTGWAVCTSSGRGKSTSGGGQECRAAVDVGGWASGDRSRYREYVKTRWIRIDLGAKLVCHRLSWCWHRWVFYICGDPARGVACQKGHNVQVCSLDTRAKNRHTAWDDIGLYTHGTVQTIVPKLVCNAWSYNQHGEHSNTRSQRWDCVIRWEAGEPARVLHSAPFGFFGTAHLAASGKYCSSWLEAAGGWRLRCCALRASGGSLMVYSQLSHLEATLSCHQQNSRDVFCQRWRSSKAVYCPLGALT